MSDAPIEKFYPTSQKAWRDWLEINHKSKQAVWLICYKKQSKIPTVSWSDLVDEALCFGWIDSVRKTHDTDSFIQFFSPRKARGTWSKVNKDKIEMLIETGKMTAAGLAVIEQAKKNGSWTILDEVEALIIPADLEAAFEKKPKARAYYMSLSKSVQKQILSWLVLAKLPATRQKRIAEVIENAELGQKPKHMR